MAGQEAVITRGVARLLKDMGYHILLELTLGNGRRADVVGLDAHGRFVLVEVKSSLSDFRTDGKWRDYLPFCDLFYFAVAPDFPIAALPEQGGVIVADAHHGAVVRHGVIASMHASRRKALTVRFARTAAARLASLIDAFPAGSTRML